MENATQKDYKEHLGKLTDDMNNKLLSAARFVPGYLRIVGISDPGVGVATTSFPLSISYTKGKEERKRTGKATYGLPESVQVEINRAAAGYDPANTKLVKEIDRANRLGIDYTPDPKNPDIATEFKKHFRRRNGKLPTPENDIGALVGDN